MSSATSSIFVGEALNQPDKIFCRRMVILAAGNHYAYTKIHAEDCPKDDDSRPVAAARAGTIARVRPLLRAHGWRITATYALFNLENVLQLLQPWVLGVTIDGLLQGDFTRLFALAGLYLSAAVLGIGRRMYDTRLYTRIYADLAAGLVERQRRQSVDVSRIVARAAMSREIVDFFERDVAVVLTSVYSTAGALVMLGCYDLHLALFSLVSSFQYS